MVQLTIILKPSEKDALILLATNEYREPRAQAAILIREGLERRGFLKAEQIKQKQQGESESSNDSGKRNRAVEQNL